MDPDHLSTADSTADRTDQERIDALAAAIDRHWLESSVAQGFARCSCGGWRQEIPGDLTVPGLGEHFRPFSDHVAAAILAARDGWTLVPSEVAEFVCTAEYLDGLRAEIARLREAVFTEWRNGNMAEDARIRILVDPADAALAGPD